MARLVLLSALISSRSLACYIQGVDSGVCRSASELIDNGDINYCASSITGVYDSVCVPREFGGKGFQFTTQSEFSFGLFPNHTVKAKDKWIAKYTTNAISRRKEVESANGALSMLPWEGELGKILIHFTKNVNCEKAFKNYMCYMNFPRCDEAENALNLCTSVCENFFKACDYPKDYWRCGLPEYNGYDAPEVAKNVDATNGQPLYVLSWWPGLPFRKNDGVRPICTPGSANGAQAAAPAWAAIAVFVTAMIAAAAAR